MPYILHLIQILGFKLKGCCHFCGTICCGLNVCVCFWCFCLDIADVVEASGKCSLLYDNSPSLLIIT